MQGAPVDNLLYLHKGAVKIACSRYQTIHDIISFDVNYGICSLRISLLPFINIFLMRGRSILLLLLKIQLCTL